MNEECAGDICETSDDKMPETCPRCGGKGKKVGTMTVRYLVQGPFQERVKDSSPYHFCRSPECPIVYYSENGGSHFTREELTKKVTIKEKDDPLPICYCFNFFRHDVEREIKATGRTTIPDFISAQVKAGNCFCEHTNPQGTCCLGNVNAVVKGIKKGVEG